MNPCHIFFGKRYYYDIVRGTFPQLYLERQSDGSHRRRGVFLGVAFLGVIEGVIAGVVPGVVPGVSVGDVKER